MELVLFGQKGYYGSNPLLSSCKKLWVWLTFKVNQASRELLGSMRLAIPCIHQLGMGLRFVIWSCEVLVGSSLVPSRRLVSIRLSWRQRTE